MIDLKRRRSLGDSVAEWLQTLPYEIDGYGEGLWKIVPAGESFGFEGADLAEFVKRSVLRLLDVGGIPVRHADDGPLLWLEQMQYGQTKEEMADAIVAEWLAAGGGDPPWGWLWFVTRDVLNSARRPQSKQTS